MFFTAKRKLLKCLIIIGLFVFSSQSQELVPPIQNYSPKNYEAASQNWDIAVSENGLVYSANNQGLLVFDGFKWELFTLESESIIRSVYPFKDRIYTGSYKEFGFWEYSVEGCLMYNSLMHLMENEDLGSDEYWEITSYNDDIYFRSFGGVFKYNGTSIERIDNLVSTAMTVYQNKLILAPRRSTMRYLNNQGKLNFLEGNLKPIEDLNIIDLEAFGDSLYIGSREALYIYSDARVTKVRNSELNQLIEKYELNHIKAVNNNELILGTIKNGIIHYKIKEDEIHVYNRNSGLQNNTVLGITGFRENIWLALDKGVDRIDLNAPIRFYTDNNGELGAVYDIKQVNSNFYLASNTGVYTFQNEVLELVESAEDHTWSLELYNDELFAHHNTGFYKIKNDRFLPIDTRTGSFTSLKMQNSDDMIIGNYTGLSLYDPDTESIQEIEGVDFPVKYIVFGGENTLWAAHPYEGIYQVDIENIANITIKKTSPLNNSKNFSPKIYNVNNQVLLYINDVWYRHNPFTDEFETFNELRDYNGYRLLFQEKTEYVFVEESSGNIVFTDLNDNEIVISSEDLNDRLVKANENLVKLNDSIAYITLNDGFAEVNLNAIKRKREREWLSIPYVKQFSDENQRYVLSESPEIPYRSSKNLNLDIALPAAEASQLTYILRGEEKLSGTVNDGRLNFQNLRYGHYTLDLIAEGFTPSTQAKNSYSFSIAPPWYLSNWAKLFYVFAFISIVYLIYRLNKIKLKKHQLLLEEKFEKEHQERLNQIEKDKLINEIDMKRKELANTTMMAAKKNEVLMEIQGELSKDKEKFSNQFRLKRIMNKINSAVKNKDEWKVFETNFNEVHEDFFKDILQQYPKLTSKDLKLCSYLKMNLSSKEIAPLMGISVRGVEVHRYRLRKKMKLDSDVNLTKFLIKNF